MADELIDKKVTQDEADRLMRPLELDLTSIFKLIEEDVITLFDSADKNISPEALINDLDSMVRSENNKQTLEDQIINKSVRDVTKRLKEVINGKNIHSPNS